jgi:hypothetical protein
VLSIKVAKQSIIQKQVGGKKKCKRKNEEEENKFYP